MPDNPIASTQIRAFATIVGAQRQSLGCAALADDMVVELELRRLRGEGLSFKEDSGGNWRARSNYAQAPRRGLKSTHFCGNCYHIRHLKVLKIASKAYFEL
jgi:hypothetical protein